MGGHRYVPQYALSRALPRVVGPDPSGCGKPHQTRLRLAATARCNRPLHPTLYLTTGDLFCSRFAMRSAIFSDDSAEPFAISASSSIR